MGPAAGGAVYSPALTDFIFMTAATSYMFVTGPNVVKQVLNETISPEELGGASVHAVKSGVADFVFNDDENTLLGVKMLLSYLPSNNIENAPFLVTDDPVDRIEESLRDIVPEDPDKPYDVRDVIRLITDKGKFLEIAESYAPNIIIGLARFGGFVTGIIANQPKVMAVSFRGPIRNMPELSGTEPSSYMLTRGRRFPRLPWSCVNHTGVLIS